MEQARKKRFFVNFRKHWNTPKDGELVSNKELTTFSVGGMGIKSINSMLTYLQLAPTCLLIATVYGLSPSNIMWLFIITNIIGIVKTPFVSLMVDNTRTKMGKFRPYLLWAGIPSVIGVIGLTWFIPLSSTIMVRIILIGIFINLLSIAQPLYNNAYMGISQVITPNSAERTKIMSFSEFFANLGPSIIQFALPTLAGIFFGVNGMLNIWAYRIFLPIFSISGFILGLLTMYTTKERVINTEDNITKIKFFNGIKQIGRNKYFWIVTISKAFDGFKGILTLLLGWICAYQIGRSDLQGIILTIVAVAYTPGMLLAPIFMKKFGPRKFGFGAHLFNCVFALLMLFTFRQGFIFFVIALFFYNFALGPQYIIQNSILSDGFDYQQDREGIRIEGFAQNFQLMITTIGGILSTIVFTYIYQKNGIIADAVTGLTDYGYYLTNASIREPIIQSIIIIVIIASILSAIPYLFCDMNAERTKAIRESLENKKRLKEERFINKEIM